MAWISLLLFHHLSLFYLVPPSFSSITISFSFISDFHGSYLCRARESDWGVHSGPFPAVYLPNGYSAVHCYDPFQHFMHDVPLSARNILEDPELKNAVKAFSHWPTFPQVFIKGEFVGGSDIVLNMHQTGELKKKLEDIVSKQ